MACPPLLITGGAGFIGSALVRRARAERPDRRVIVLDALTYAARTDNLPDDPGVRLVVGDIRDVALVTDLLRAEGIDQIVNCAAETHVDRSIAGPDVFVETNVVGTLALLKAAQAAWLDGGRRRGHRFHHISTDEVYGPIAAAHPPASEDRRFAPSSPYAASKAAGEHLVMAWHRTYGLDVSISRCCNNYGPRQLPDKLIPRALCAVLQGRSVPLYGDGMAVRDWLHVDDHAAAVLALLAVPANRRVHNIAGHSLRPNGALLAELCALIDQAFADDADLARRYPTAPPAAGRPSAGLIVAAPDRPGHDHRYAIDDTPLRAAFRDLPLRSFASGLAATLRWYLDHPEAWEGAAI